MCEKLLEELLDQTPPGLYLTPTFSGLRGGGWCEVMQKKEEGEGGVMEGTF